MARKRDEAVETLDQALKARTGEGALGALYERLEGGKVRCFACGHRCLIPDGHDGICRVRFNRGGTLFVPRGYVAGLQVDPIEKKPFFHAFPGAVALSFGMLGCDLHCGYCQNWLTSQALRDPSAVAPPRDIEAAELVEIALRYGAPVMVSTYNEPLITTEWAIEVFSRAKPRGITCGYVSNGNATPEVLRYIRPYVDLYKVDLKSFRDAEYRQLGGKLENVLASIRALHEMGFWVELVTLVVPGFNDAEDELRDMARFIADVSVDIPWHVTAFHQDYRMTENDPATPRHLLRAATIGKEAGLRYVYAGNLPGRVGDFENTRCPSCNELLIERSGYRVLSFALSAEGTCPKCATPIAGFWRRGWTPPPADGGLPGRRPRALPLAAGPLFPPSKGTRKEPT
jgi:pyruvate formate lyase activating enzyme